MPFKITKGKVVALLAFFTLVFCAASIGKIVEDVASNEVVVCQTFMGELYVYTESGPKWQGWGSCYHYPREFEAEFLLPEAWTWGAHSGDAKSIRFNDQGSAYISGVARVKMPLDTESVLKIHRSYGSPAAVESELVEADINRAIYNAGPMMSSKESAADRRAELLAIIQDQAANGVFKTVSVAEEVKNTLTGEIKTVKVAKVVTDVTTGHPVRDTLPRVAEFNIEIYGLDIKRIAYDPDVQRQINAQREGMMEIETAIVEAKAATQRRITVEESGRADAMKAKWEQEKINATEIAQAEKEKAVAELQAAKKLEVAKLERKAAAETKQKEILLGQGEAERKKLVMRADGALAQKLKTLEVIHGKYAEALANRKVPTTVFGGAGGGSADYGSGTDVQTFFQLQNAAALKQLNLNMDISK